MRFLFHISDAVMLVFSAWVKTYFMEKKDVSAKLVVTYYHQGVKVF